MLLPYDSLWRYFAWCNQVLSVFTLWTLSVYLARHNRPMWITVLPAMFMTAVTVTYIFFAPEGFGSLLIDLLGLRTAYTLSITIGLLTAFGLGTLFLRQRRNLSPTPTLSE